MPPQLRARTPRQSSTATGQLPDERFTASTSEEDERDSGTDEDDDKPAPVPHKKRKKAAARSTKVRSTGNDVFSTLPLDLLYQICGDLDPGTLLAISQVSKPIHRTLASRSSIKLWEHARRTANLPDLSEPLPEPKYAFLAQGSFCQICGPSRKTEAELPLRVRACPKCFKANLKTEKKMRKENPELHSHTFECALSSPFSAAGNKRNDGMPYYWEPDLAPLSDHLYSLAPALPVDGELGEDAEMSEPGVSLTVFEYHRERLGYVKRVKKDAEDILAFQYRAVEQLEADRKLVVEKRYEQLCEKVAKAGYSKEDFSVVRPWAEKRPVLLTDQQWVRISKDVLAAVVVHQSRRLEDERRAAQQRRVQQLHPLHRLVQAAVPAAEPTMSPLFHTFVELKSVVQLWRPDDAVVDPSSWSSLVPIIVAEIQDNRCKDKLSCFNAAAQSLRAAGVVLDPHVVAVLDNEPSAFVDASDTLAPLHAQLPSAVVDNLLQNAAAMVKCGTCRLMSHCRRVLDHWSTSFCGSRRAVTNDSTVSFVKLLSECVALAGMDPSTATRKDMIDQGAVFDVGTKDDVVVRKQSWDDVTFGSVMVRRPTHAWWGVSQHVNADLFVSITPNKANLEAA